MSQSIPEPPREPSGWKNHFAWLAICVIAGLLLAPVFHSVPPRMKFIGIHAWVLAACLGAFCGWSAVFWGIRSRRWVCAVIMLITLSSLGLLAHWGYGELKHETAQRMPMIPLPQQVGSPEQLAQSMQMQRELAQALVPTFTDYQRRRMNSLALRRIRPLVLWSGELLIAAVVSVLACRQVERGMTKTSDSDSLTSETPRTHIPLEKPPRA